MQRILFTTTIYLLGLLPFPSYASSDIDEIDSENTLTTTLLFKCDNSQIIGINTHLKYSPWFLEFSLENNKMRLVNHHKARFRHNNTRLTWVDYKSENQIQIDPLKDQEITYIKKIFDTKETIKSICTVWIR